MVDPTQDPDWSAQREIELFDLALSLSWDGNLEWVPGDVTHVRFVDPDERRELEFQYLTDHGFDVRWTVSGFKLNRSKKAKSDRDAVKRALSDALYRLEVMYPVHPRYRVPYSEVQWNTVFNYYLERLIPCLRQRGYDVGTIPSREFFLQHTPRWSPYDNIGPQDVHLPHGRTRWWPEEQLLAYEELQVRCPPKPPIADLFPR